MAIAEGHPTRSTSPHLSVRSKDTWIILAYLVFAAIAITLSLYGGPGMTDVDVGLSAVLP